MKLEELIQEAERSNNGRLKRMSVLRDKVCLYEEMMTNDDNVESSLLTSSFIENTQSVQVLLQVAHVKLEIQMD